MHPGYLIIFKSRITGVKSDIDKQAAFANKGFAEKYAKLLNEQYKELEHWVIDAKPGTPFLDIINYELSNLKLII